MLFGDLEILLINSVLVRLQENFIKNMLEFEKAFGNASLDIVVSQYNYQYNHSQSMITIYDPCLVHIYKDSKQV